MKLNETLIVSNLLFIIYFFLIFMYSTSHLYLIVEEVTHLIIISLLYFLTVFYLPLYLPFYLPFISYVVAEEVALPEGTAVHSVEEGTSTRSNSFYDTYALPLASTLYYSAPPLNLRNLNVQPYGGAQVDNR